MITRILKVAICTVLVVNLPYLYAQTVLNSNTESIASKQTNGDEVSIRTDAPLAYLVKKGDTLWDIAGLFLDKPWLWPELWRNNTQIENPHLIYPGDQLRLRYENGNPVLELVRSDKTRITLTPDARKQEKNTAIGVLPWHLIQPYIENDSVMSEQEYDALPRVLGNERGTNRFVNADFVISQSIYNPQVQYEIVRRQRTLEDSRGAVLGIQVDHISDVEMTNTDAGRHQVVRVKKSNIEAQPGDRLKPSTAPHVSPLSLQAAGRQEGEIVGNLHQRSLAGKNDIVIVNLGNRLVEPGTVMGIYSQGPAIYDGNTPVYESASNSAKQYFSFEERVEQPAFKVGELVIFKTFEYASYALITNSRIHLKGGEIVGHP